MLVGAEEPPGHVPGGQEGEEGSETLDEGYVNSNGGGVPYINPNTNIVKKTDNNLPFVGLQLMRVPIKFNSFQCRALLDTGASVSLVSVKLFDKIPRTQVTMIMSPEHCLDSISTVSGERIACIGRYEICFTMFDRWFKQLFLVLSSLHEGMILGIDFIVHNDVIIKAQQRLINLEGIEHFHPQRQDFPIYNVKLNNQFPLDHLGQEGQVTLGKILEKHSSIFVAKMSQMGTGTTIKHSIHLTGPPIRQALRRTPNALRPIVKAEIDEMLAAKVIRPSCSPFASPIVVVKKPKSPGEWRFCVDYRRVNDLTVKDAYPLPRIDETIDALGGAKFFSTLDLLSGYWQIEIEEPHKYITAFVCELGQFEWNRMSFGLCNAPSTFQRFMNHIFREVLHDYVLIYLDDIIIFSKTLEEHARHLDNVFKILELHGLKLKLKKCVFGRTEIEYLGHCVSASGVQPVGEKVEAIKKLKEPKSVKEVQSILGVMNYYRRFVQSYAEIAHPLTALTRKGTAWVWGDKERNAFEKIKSVLTSRPILGYPDFTREFIVHTDASGYGIGAVLSQMQRPPHSNIDREVVISYTSRHLNDREIKWSVTEKECVAIIHAVTKFKSYLYGRVFTCVTDHRPLEWLMKKAEPSGRLARWALMLQEYQIKIGYRPGKTNQNADFLSRFPLPLVANVIFGVDDWIEDQSQDPHCKQIVAQMNGDGNEGRKRNFKYTFLNSGLLSKKDGRIVVPKVRVRSILEMSHDHKLSGHLGISKVLARIQSKYTWPHLATDVIDHIRHCPVCARRRAEGFIRAPLLSMPVYDIIWETLAMDICGPLAETYRSNKYILVITDYATRYIITCPMRDQTAQTVARKFIFNVLLRFGSPQRVLTDQGRNFLSNLVGEVCTLFEVKQLRTTAYHPQGDGLVERFNKTMADMLAAYVSKHPENWDKVLPFVTLAYNAHTHKSLRHSPFYLLFGRQPALATDILHPDEVKPEDARVVTNLEPVMDPKWRKALEFAHEFLATAQSTQKWNYDKFAVQAPMYYVDDDVLVQAPKAPGKFNMKWEGPFKVLERITELTYRVQNLKNNGSSIIHVNRLKRWSVRPGDSPVPPIKNVEPKVTDSLVQKRKVGRPPKVPLLTPEASLVAGNSKQTMIRQPIPTKRSVGRPRKMLTPFKVKVTYPNNVPLGKKRPVGRPRKLAVDLDPLILNSKQTQNLTTRQQGREDQSLLQDKERTYPLRTRGPVDETATLIKKSPSLPRVAASSPHQTRGNRVSTPIRRYELRRRNV